MKKNTKLPCCKRISAVMNEKSNYLVNYDCLPLYYSPSIRTFFILLCSKNNTHIGGNMNAGFIIKFCPWCGTKFPKSLADKKERILANEHLHNDDNCSLDNTCFPQEFLTDEWWKKRGL